MDESVRYSRISWIITILVVIGNFVSGKLGLPALIVMIWGTISLIALIVGVVYGVKGIKSGKKNGNKSAVTQGRVGLILNSIILVVFILGSLVAILVALKS
jgi:hypothetical protein